MVQSVVPGVAIRGVAATVPRRVRQVTELGTQFDPEEVRKISESTGVFQAHIADPGVCASDLCADAARRIMRELDWAPESIGLIVFVTQNPDYILPATGGVVHGWLGLPKTTLTIDINQGCSGFVTGLWTAASLLSRMNMSRALVMAGDIASCLVNRNDCGSTILFGDGGTATAIELDQNASPLVFTGGSDGTGADHLCVATGGFRKPAPPHEASLSPWGMGALSMNGPEVFSFASREVPPLIHQTLAGAGWTADSVDQFLFHQANQFLIQHLSRKLKIPMSKVPLSLGEYGNTSSASIPLTLAATQTERHFSGRTLMAGFGVGLSWAACAAECQSTLMAGVEPFGQPT